MAAVNLILFCLNVCVNECYDFCVQATCVAILLVLLPGLGQRSDQAVHFIWVQSASKVEQ